MPYTDEDGPARRSAVSPSPVAPTPCDSSAPAREYEAARAKSARIATEENSMLGSMSSASEKASSKEKGVVPGRLFSTCSLADWSSSSAQRWWLYIAGK